MPRIWSETIAAHRDAVRDAILDATAALVAEHGLTGVTMSQIARESGIGRATLYKYFPDIGSILAASTTNASIAAHLHHLAEVSEAARPGDRLEAVLRGYAHPVAPPRRWQRSGGPAASGRAREPRAHATAGVHHHAAARSRRTRRGPRRLTAGELAAYCLHALTAAYGLSSEAALGRLINVILTGVRARPGNGSVQPGQLSPAGRAARPGRSRE